MGRSKIFHGSIYRVYISLYVYVYIFKLYSFLDFLIYNSRLVLGNLNCIGFLDFFEIIRTIKHRWMEDLGFRDASDLKLSYPCVSIDNKHCLRD